MMGARSDGPAQPVDAHGQRAREAAAGLLHCERREVAPAAVDVVVVVARGAPGPRRVGFVGGVDAVGEASSKKRLAGVDLVAVNADLDADADRSPEVPAGVDRGEAGRARGIRELAPGGRCPSAEALAPWLEPALWSTKPEHRPVASQRQTSIAAPSTGAPLLTSMTMRLIPMAALSWSSATSLWTRSRSSKYGPSVISGASTTDAAAVAVTAVVAVLLAEVVAD